MTKTMTFAFVLTSALILGAATPSFAAPRTGLTASDVTAQARARAQSRARQTGRAARAQEPVRLNRDGLPYRVPEDCAYPRTYSGDGAAVFQLHGCRLP
jgi:hypothetical protein